MFIVNITLTNGILFVLLLHIIWGYENMTVENHRLCAGVTKRKIELRKNEKSALIVSQKNLDKHSIDWSSRSECEFKVSAGSSNGGIFAVIQTLNLRKNETTNECIDYIQFKRFGSKVSTKYCGEMGIEEDMRKNIAEDFNPQDFVPTKNSYVDPEGLLSVTIFVSREAVYGKKTNFVIVFTSYKACSGNDESYIPCIPQRRDKCIYYGFFNDNIVNCPYPNCMDEGGCYFEKVVPRSKLSSNMVLFSSLSTLAILFCIFVISAYLCRKYGKLCWNEEFSFSERERTNVNQSNQSGDLNSVSQPNAPPAVEEDKDLPPTYESLFPNR